MASQSHPGVMNAAMGQVDAKNIVIMSQGNCANNQSGDSFHSTAVGEQDTQTTHNSLDKTGRTVDWYNVVFLKLTQKARAIISSDHGRYLWG